MHERADRTDGEVHVKEQCEECRDGGRTKGTKGGCGRREAGKWETGKEERRRVADVRKSLGREGGWIKVTGKGGKNGWKNRG